MLCKILGFHGGDYEECRLLGYKNPVHTSQETYYLSATEPSRLMLCKKYAVFWAVSSYCLLLRADVSEQRIASIIRTTRISELRTLALTS
jgi:hypothetical protein